MPYEELIADLKQRSLYRQLRTIDAVKGTSVSRAGRLLVNFASNDYLGLAQHPKLKMAAADAAQRFGSGSGASRLITGTLAIHSELEARLAAFKQTPAALTFESGYAAALGTIPALFGQGDVIILDKLAHASLIDGARLSGAEIRVYPHNRLQRLWELLDWAREKRRGAKILIITESIFSMDGDSCPLPEIVDLKDEFGAALLLDEAHAIGVLGPNGAGLAAEFGLIDRVEIHLGTLSKAIGSSGGFIAGPSSLIDLLINRARTFIYSTAPPPAVIAAAIEGLDIIASGTGDHLRAALWRNYEELSLKLKRPKPEGKRSGIVPIIVGAEEQALSFSEDLMERGFLVPAVRFPTVPRGSARLRVTLSAAHQLQDVVNLREAVNALYSG
ncbi:MAG: 8-amino-7-oxononanoate synthase [Verrucomicrobia bacterium]|nr:8-amino-7-oxononanoate synthase [Verrucomicrobiota bacterium]MBV8481806.1 8-amino-7-oxononanoate synthase [Verrucomicrobiota bacterium]